MPAATWGRVTIAPRLNMNLRRLLVPLGPRRRRPGDGGAGARPDVSAQPRALPGALARGGRRQWPAVARLHHRGRQVATQDPRWRTSIRSISRCSRTTKTIASMRTGASILSPWARGGPVDRAWPHRVGASTLSMQAARLLEARPRTLPNKIVEAARALPTSNGTIPNARSGIYLTLAPMGGNLEGVRSASFAYFGKEPRQLSVAEAALLVAIQQSPSRRRPDRAPAAAQAWPRRRCCSAGWSTVSSTRRCSRRQSAARCRPVGWACR